MSDRTGVLLRFEPHLLERVERDVEREGMNRHEWLMFVIERYLTAVAEPRARSEAKFADVLKTPRAEAAREAARDG